MIFANSAWCLSVKTQNSWRSLQPVILALVLLPAGLLPPDLASHAADNEKTIDAQDASDGSRESLPDDPEWLRLEALKQFYRGNSAMGLRLATKAHDLAPMNTEVHFAFTIGLLQTQQNQRLVEEGLDSFKVDAHDVLGHRDEAFKLAHKLAAEGHLRNLFTLYNRANRSQELIDYLEARWPSLDAFAVDHPHDSSGYGLMAQVALAYSRTSDAQQFNNALSLVDDAITTLSSQGVDNMVFMMEKAIYMTLAGQPEDAITQMEGAVERGLRGNPVLDWSQPVFEQLANNSRFIALRAAIQDKVNVQRDVLDLEPIDKLAER